MPDPVVRKAPPPPPIDGNHSKVIRFMEGFQWKDVLKDDQNLCDDAARSARAPGSGRPRAGGGDDLHEPARDGGGVRGRLDVPRGRGLLAHDRDLYDGTKAFIEAIEGFFPKRRAAHAVGKKH